MLETEGCRGIVANSLASPASPLLLSFSPSHSVSLGRNFSPGAMCQGGMKLERGVFGTTDGNL